MTPPAQASPADHYSGPYFGEDNFLPGAPASFALSVEVPQGTHELRVDWDDGGEVVATRTVTVTQKHRARA